MPKNNSLEPVKLPMKIRFDEEPITNFVNNIEAINIKLLHAPTMGQLRGYLIPFLEATWAEDPLESQKLTKREKDKIIRDCLEGKALPTALETVNLVFLIEGISLQEVTHILRYRNASFSADCSGDKWWSHKDALTPFAIEESGEFYERYKQIVLNAKKLYCDMIDTRQISIMDARYILPRCLSTYYFMRINLKDALHFIRQRIDRQIQPETDNIIAYKMYMLLVSQYPVMSGLIDILGHSDFYAKMARTGKATNLYFPDGINDTFEWNEEDFIYKGKRSDIKGVGSQNARTKFEHEAARLALSIEITEKANSRLLELEYSEEERG